MHRLKHADWALVLPVLLAGSSLEAARAWLGYVPEELQEDAHALFQHLQAGAPHGVGNTTNVRSVYEGKLHKSRRVAPNLIRVHACMPGAQRPAMQSPQDHDSMHAGHH